MDWRSQNAALSRFRRRSPTNLLVSTSVLEEGLDIAPCNFVCRFDLFAHPIGYIQSRGRARHRNSRFIMMTERHNIAQRALLRTVANSDAALRVWLDGLTDDRLAQANPPLDDADNDGDGGFDGTAFLEEPSTGARLYPSDAVALVSYYVALLKGAAPEFCIESYGSGTFTCELKLPANAKVRRVVSSICPSKRKARCQAAFLACVELRKLGALDEHLVPKRPPKIGAILDSERDQTGGLLATRSRKSKFSAKIPDLWQRTLGQAEYDGAVMVLQGTLLRIDLAANGEDASLYRPILVLTANNMPAVTPFDLFLHDHTLHFPGATSSFPLRLSERQAELAYHFTLRLLRLVGRKDWQCEFADMSYLCVPVLPSSARKEVIDGHDDLDWAEVARVAMEETVPLHSVNAEDLAEHIVLENPDAHRTIAYSVERMRPDLNPYSKADEGLRETKFTNFFEYYRNVTCKHAQTLPTTCDPHQPMIEVNRLSRLENFLVTHAKRHGKLRRRQARFLIPQFTYLHSISASVHRFGLLMPSILSRISAQLMVSDLNKSQFDGRMDESALLTAVTPSAAGMAFDYERFEFLGDTVLKLLATAHVFASSAAQNEGELHLARRELVSNATLMKHSRRLKLYRFIQAKSFTNRTWCPPNFREAVNSEAVLASATGSPNKGLEDAVKKSTNSQEANIDVQMEDAITGRPHEAASTAQASAPRPSKGGKEVSNSQILNEKSLVRLGSNSCFSNDSERHIELTLMLDNLWLHTGRRRRGHPWGRS